MNQAFKKQLGPGVWVDQDDNMHFSMPDILKHLGVAYTKENEAELEKVLREVISKEAPDGIITVRQHGCPYCGVKGPGQHAPGCPIGEGKNVSTADAPRRR